MPARCVTLVAMQVAGEDCGDPALSQQRHDRVVGSDRAVGEHEPHRAGGSAPAQRVTRVCQRRGVGLQAEDHDLDRPVLGHIVMAWQMKRCNDCRSVVVRQVVLTQGDNGRSLAQQGSQRIEDRPVE